MKKLKENMNGLLICLFELVVGILLLIDPVGFTSGIIVTAGIALIILGIINCVKYIREDILRASKGQFLTKGLISLIIGAFCVFNSQWFIATFSALTVIYGVVVLISAVEKIQLCIDMYRQKKSKWYFAAISAAVSLICAIIILKSPFETTAVLWMFTGISLIVEAVFDLFTLIANRRKQMEENEVAAVADGPVVENTTKVISLAPDNVTPIRSVDERLVSYNIEMTEVTGGTFWKAYTPEQIAGTEEFPPITNLQDGFTALSGLMQYYPPIDLYDERLRELAKKLGPAWIRVSGTWATKTYYDFDGSTDGKAPDGYASVLTKDQWIGVLDFVKYVGGKLLVSVSNCAGDHPDNGSLNLTQAKKLFDFSHEYGVDIADVEFMNEPNMMEMSGAPAGYIPADYARDQDILFAWVRENYPNCLLVGPCTTGDPTVVSKESKGFGAGIGSMAKTCTTQELLEGTKIKLDVFSYHYYNGVSERLASAMPCGHWPADEAHSDEYLAVAPNCARGHVPLRNKFVPGGQMWVTESGDAGGGGDTWASTYLDVLRTLNELGSFATITDGVIFHNTLASSDYGYLEHGSFKPRPNYFAVLLWNKLMGSTVYDCNNPNREGAHIFCHSRKDKKPGVVFLIINNSLSKTTDIEIPKQAERYTLSAESMRSTVMQLNGKELMLSGTADIPELVAEKQNAGVVTLAPGSCTFLVM